MRIYRFNWESDFLILEKFGKQSYGIHSEGYVLIDKENKDSAIEDLKIEDSENNSYDHNYRGCTFEVVEDEEIIKREFEKLRKSLQADIELSVKRHAVVCAELKKMTKM